MKGKFGVFVTVSLIAIIAGAALFLNMNLHSTMKTMAFIEGRMRGSTFVDYDHSINVESSKDIGWWKKDGNWYIMYGKLQLEFTKKQLQDEEFLAQVGRIGIDIRGDLEAGVLSFYWFGEELEEWVPR